MDKVKPTLERAIEIAARAHAGQVDKAGQPYILHPLRVMLSVKGEVDRIVAVLHDVVEDTDVTLGALAAEGFPTEVLAAIEALTKKPDEHRLPAAHRAAANPIARVVKLADVEDNMDLSRIPHPTAADYARLEEYKLVRAILVGSIVNEESPVQFSIESFTAYIKTLDNQTFTTLHRKVQFLVEVVPDGLEFTPKKTGKPRLQSWKYIDRVCKRFLDTQSLHPGDYHDLTVNASYILTLISAYLFRK